MSSVSVRDNGAQGGWRRALRRHGPMVVVWSAVCALFFAPLLLQQARLPNGDFGAQFYSFARFQFSEMAAGHWPLWSPGSYSGFPFAADTQSAVFYPPRLLTILLSLPRGLSYYGLELEAVAHVWLAGVLTYALAFDQTRCRAAALLGALAFALGGYLVSYPIQQLAILEAITWLPLVLLLLRRGFRPGVRPVVWLLLASGALSLSLRAGHPQTFLHIGYLTAAYFLFLAWQERWSWAWALVLGAMTLLATVGLSAVAWLPALRYVAETTRTTTDYAFVATGFPLLDYLQTLVPGALTLWSPQYIGLTAVVFVVLGWVGRRALRDRDRAEFAFWAIAAVVAAWLSLGDSGILFELAYRIAPGLSLFRQQERWAGVFSFSLALVAAQGFTLWLRGAAAEKDDRSAALRRTIAVVAIGLGAAGLTLAVASSVAVDGWTTTWARQWLLLALAGWTLVLPHILSGRSSANAAKLVRLRAAVPWAMLALLAADLFLSTRPTMHLTAGSPAAFWPQPAWMTTLQQGNPGRIDSQNLFVLDVGEAYGLQDIRGISPLKAQAVERYEALPRRLRWQLLNVTHVIASEAIEPGLSLVMPVTESLLPGESVDAALYRFDDALPRAWPVAEFLTAESDEAAVALMTQPGFDPAQTVVLTGDLPSDLPTAATLTPLLSMQQTPRGLVIAIDAAAPAVVVISEWWRDGWRATLDDGTSLPLLRANAGLSAVVVPAGSHTITLRFQPWDITVGWVLTLLTLLAAVLVGWRWRPVVTRRAVHAAVDVPRTAVALPAMSARTWLVVLTAVTLLGFGLRVYHLGAQELRGDEAFNYLLARLPLNEIVPELLNQGDPHPPLPYLALGAWVKLAGVSELALRMLSALAGTLLLPVLAVLGRRMGGARAGLLVAGLAAIAPGLIWLSQDARLQYALVTLFAALATAVLVRPSPEQGIRRWAYWGVYAVLAALTVYQHYYGIFTLLAHGLYLWLTPGRKRDLAAWVLCGAAVALALLPWLWASSAHLLGAGHLSDPSQPELARHLTDTGIELLLGQSLSRAAGRWLFLVGAAVAGYGTVALLRRRATAGWGAMLLGWLALALLGAYLVRFSRGTFNAYYVTIAAPAWWLLVSGGLVALWQGRRTRRVAAAVATAVLVVAMLLGLRNLYTDPAYSRTLGYRAVVDHLAAVAGPNDILIDHFPDPVWDYYLRDSILARSLQPASTTVAAPQTEAALAQLAATHDRLWFVPYLGSVWDPENVAGRWLDDHLLLEEQGQFVRHRLLAYRDLGHSADILTTLDNTAGPITLHSVYLTVNGRPVDPAGLIDLTPGDTLDVTLLWSTREPLAANYSAFVHLLGGDGALLAQHDGTPHDGARPTPTWLPGELILDRHSLTIPDGTTGNGLLLAGLYNSATVERLMFDDSRDAVEIGRVRFAPPRTP